MSTGGPEGAQPSSASALDDLLGLSGGDFAERVLAAAPASTPPALALDPKPALMPAAFQASWGALQPAARFVHPLPPSALAAIEANNHQVRCKTVS